MVRDRVSEMHTGPILLLQPPPSASTSTEWPMPCKSTITRCRAPSGGEIAFFGKFSPIGRCAIREHERPLNGPSCTIANSLAPEIPSTHSVVNLHGILSHLQFAYRFKIASFFEPSSMSVRKYFVAAFAVLALSSFGAIGKGSRDIRTRSRFQDGNEASLKETLDWFKEKPGPIFERAFSNG